MSLYPPKILIVEDEISLLRILADEFTQAGFLALTALNGQEGLAMALQERPNLIILDVVMPVMDGPTMLKLLRQDAWGSRVPVIMLTNISNAPTIDQSLDHGVDHYLVKADWELKDIIEIVKTKLSSAVPSGV